MCSEVNFLSLLNDVKSFISRLDSTIEPTSESMIEALVMSLTPAGYIDFSGQLAFMTYIAR